MLPYVHIFGHPVKSFALLCTLAMLGAFLPVRSEARRLGLNVVSMSWLVLASTFVGWLGAYVMFAITQLGLPFEEWRKVALKPGTGAVWYGGFLASWYLVHRYARHNGIPPRVIYDISIFAVLVAQAAGRVGCFLGGCCYGSHTDLPWGVVLSNPDYTKVALHPSPLYEALCLGLLFVWLWSTRRQRRPGHTAALYLMSSGAVRFVVEFSRGDTVRGFVIGWLSTSQFIALVMMATGAFLYFRFQSTEGERTPADLGRTLPHLP